MPGSPTENSKKFSGKEAIERALELTERLRQHNNFASDILLKARAIEKHEQCCMEIQSALDAHNSVPFAGLSRSGLVAELKREQRILQAVQQENQDLKETVQENNVAMNYILRKYHQHTEKLLELQRKDQMCPQVVRKVLSSVVDQQHQSFKETVEIAETVVLAAEIKAREREKLLRSVEKENLFLRSALKLSGGNSSNLSKGETSVHMEVL